MKHVLQDTYDFDFVLIGISCHAKDYRLAWKLNTSMEMHLSKMDSDLEVFNEKAHPVSTHSLFDYFDEETEQEYFLIKNKVPEGMLIPELPHADYLLKVFPSSVFRMDKILALLSQIDIVLTCFPVEVASLKSKVNLVF